MMGQQGNGIQGIYCSLSAGATLLYRLVTSVKNDEPYLASDVLHVTGDKLLETSAEPFGGRRKC